MAFGGDDPSTEATAEYFFAKNASWVPAPSMNAARLTAGMARLLDGRILVAGGDQSMAPTAEIFDPVTKVWTPTSDMPQARRLMGLVVLPDGSGRQLWLFISVSATNFQLLKTSASWLLR